MGKDEWRNQKDEWAASFRFQVPSFKEGVRRNAKKERGTQLGRVKNLPATIRRSKVAISLREMSGTLRQLNGVQFPSILHVGESL